MDLVEASRLVAAETDSASAGSFFFGLDLGRYDRRRSLSSTETDALGAEGLRRSRARGAVFDESSWSALTGLAQPLDDALAVLHYHDDAPHWLAGNDAVARILLHCAETGRSYWSFTPADWRTLLGADAPMFRAAVPWPASTTVRPFTIALAYLLGEFDGFHQIGMFDRLYLAGLVFGPDTVHTTLTEVASPLGSWGYREHDGTGRPLPGTFSQFLLLNRSPHLRDLTNEAFTRLREHRHWSLPITAARYSGCSGPPPQPATAARRPGSAATTWKNSTASPLPGPGGSNAGMRPRR
jgi:hypothetical protein